VNLSNEAISALIERVPANTRIVDDFGGIIATARLAMECPTDELAATTRAAFAQHGPMLVSKLDELHMHLAVLADQVHRLSLAVWLHCPRDEKSQSVG
jgi:hypothetical protein